MTGNRTTFAGVPEAALDTLEGARVVVLGASEATPYVPGEPSHAAEGPAALRGASQAFARQLGQLDFDLGATLLPDFATKEFRGIVDAGDVATDAEDAAGNRDRIRAATAAVLAAGAVPVLLGGDDSVPIPMLAAFEGHGPVTIVQIDAHVDWGDDIRGQTLGYGSPMRRASEMPWVTGMVQFGIRGLGSGQAWQTDDARAWGSRLIPSRTFHGDGVDAALDGIPPGTRFVLSVDCDGIDPAVFPAVAMPTPGGLTYEDLLDILEAVAARGPIAGLFLGEYVPERDDPHRLCALTAARFLAVAIGHMLEPAQR